MQNLNKDIIIIGGGIAGLFCGAILSKNGFRVRIFEKNKTIGGGLQSFERFGHTFDTGMHYFGGFEQGGVLNRICKYLGIFDKIKIKPLDAKSFDQLYFASDNKVYHIGQGKQNFIDSLSDDFPEERDNITRYIDAIYDICDNIALLNLRIAGREESFSNHDCITHPIGELIDSVTDNPKLRSVLAWNNCLYGGIQYRTPQYVAAAITKFLVDGASRFIGNSQQLADALAKVVTENSGEIFTQNAIKEINIDNKAIQYVVAEDGLRYQADNYISTIDLNAMFGLMDETKIQRSYRERLKNIPLSSSAFTLFLVFKPNAFPYYNHNFYYVEDYDSVWKLSELDENVGVNFMAFTPSETENQQYAGTMIVNVIMPFDKVKQWEDTKTGQRGAEYRSFKKDFEDKIIDNLKMIFPDIENCIKHRFSASPLTIRDYFGNKNGALYGTIHDCNNISNSTVYVSTKLSNLFLSGQNVNLHGMLGVPLTVLQTCSAFMEMNNLLKEITKY